MTDTRPQLISRRALLRSAGAVGAAAAAGANSAAAAAEIPALGRRVFLSLGARALGHFSKLKDIWFLAPVFYI